MHQRGVSKETIARFQIGFAPDNRSGLKDHLAQQGVPTSLMVNVDAARLIQVMFNLLSNAAKHSPENGQVRVGASRSGEKIRIWVKDQGPGVEGEFVKRLFEKYTQGENVDVRGIASSGLGLHISKQIIEHMGGQIGLDTKIGVGSTFWIELSEHRSAEAQVLAAESRSALLGALARLRDDDRLVLGCRYLLELSEAETAAALGVPTGTVKSRTSRALARLRGEIEG